MIYRDQTATLATQIAGFAFQSAQAEAALLTAKSPASQTTPGDQTQAQRLQATRDSVAQRIVALKAQDEALEKQLNTARVRDIPALQQQREQVQGELELQTAMRDAIGKITGMSGISGETGFAAQIGQLERSAPGLATGKPATVSPTLDSLSAARSAGVTSQAQVLFSLLGTRQSIEGLIDQAKDLHQQAFDLHTPLVNTLRKTIAQGETLAQQAAAPSIPAQGTKMPPGATPKATTAQDAQTLAATRKNFDASDREVQGNLGRLRPAQPGDDGPRAGSGQPAGVASRGQRGVHLDPPLPVAAGRGNRYRALADLCPR